LAPDKRSRFLKVVAAVVNRLKYRLFRKSGGGNPGASSGWLLLSEPPSAAGVGLATPSANTKTPEWFQPFGGFLP
jgi:hypothetical protein